MITVLHVIGRRPKGGIGSFLKNLVQVSDESVKHEFLINSSDEANSFDDFMKLKNCKVHVLPELKIKNSYEYFTELKKFYQSHNHYQYIHVHSPNIALFNYLSCCYRNNVTFCIHSHSTKYSDSFFKSIRNFILNMPIKIFPSLKFACSQNAGKFLFGNRKFTVINNGIDTTKFKFDECNRIELRDKFNSRDKNIIGHIGNFFRVKNHTFMVDIIEKLIDIDDNYEMWYIGSGELENEIKEKVNMKNLGDHVKFLGLRNDVEKIMSTLDLFLLPSLFEGIPLSCIEAQTSGVSTVISSSIDENVIISDLVSTIDLKKSPQEWAIKIDKIIKTSNNLQNRQNYMGLVQEKGYDYRDSSSQLLQAYKDNLREGD